jgi:hypothetical protein
MVELVYRFTGLPVLSALLLIELEGVAAVSGEWLSAIVNFVLFASLLVEPEVSVYG